MRSVTTQVIVEELADKAKRQHNVNTNQVVHAAEVNYNLIREDGSYGVHKY